MPVKINDLSVVLLVTIVWPLFWDEVVGANRDSVDCEPVDNLELRRLWEKLREVLATDANYSELFQPVQQEFRDCDLYLEFYLSLTNIFKQNSVDAIVGKIPGLGGLLSGEEALGSFAEQAMSLVNSSQYDTEYKESYMRLIESLISRTKNLDQYKFDNELVQKIEIFRQHAVRIEQMIPLEDRVKNHPGIAIRLASPRIPQRKVDFQKIFYVTNRQKSNDSANAYGDRESDQISFGTCDISIPWSHNIGSVEKITVFSLDSLADAEKHFMLRTVHPLDESEFYQLIKTETGQSEQDQCLVFVHGFNTSFEEAAFRTAQIAYDLNFSGPTILFSWPASKNFVNYFGQRDNAEVSALHLIKFLKEMATRSGTTRIHLIAHSMGAVVVTNAFKQFETPHHAEAGSVPLLQQMVLAAPDINITIFEQVTERLKNQTRKVTVYASTNDGALQASARIRFNTDWLGITRHPVSNVDVIDVTDIVRRNDNHGYCFENWSLLNDMFYLLRDGQNPQYRFGLKSATVPEGTFYRFLPYRK